MLRFYLDRSMTEKYGPWHIVRVFNPLNDPMDIWNETTTSDVVILLISWSLLQDILLSHLLFNI